MTSLTVDCECGKVYHLSKKEGARRYSAVSEKGELLFQWAESNCPKCKKMNIFLPRDSERELLKHSGLSHAARLDRYVDPRVLDMYYGLELQAQ